MELIGDIDPRRPLLVVAVVQEAEHLSTDLPVLVTGVGKLAACRGVLATLAPRGGGEQPRSVVNLGTAGALRDGVSGTHVIGTVVQHDLDGSGIEVLTGSNPAPPLSLGQGATLATGDRFVTDPGHRALLAETADLVDMEGYAVAMAARSLGLDVFVVKHVSDAADEGARRAWVDSVADCSRSLGEWLEANQTTFDGPDERSL